MKSGDRVRAKERIQQHYGHVGSSPCEGLCIDIEKHSRGDFLGELTVGETARKPFAAVQVRFDREGTVIVVKADQIEAVVPDVLEPCPFCGGEAYIQVDRSWPDRVTWAVYCRSCAAQGPWSKIHEGDAASQWNRRTLPPLVQAVLDTAEAWWKPENDRVLGVRTALFEAVGRWLAAREESK